VELLVGFLNRGKQDFVLETLEASFRYPMDFSFYIQNFTSYPVNRIVKPNEESSLAYSFLTPEAFAGRPIGLNVHLNYRDAVSYFILYLPKMCGGTSFVFMGTRYANFTGITKLKIQTYQSLLS